MIVQKKYNLMDFHYKGVCFDDFVVINNALFWVKNCLHRWKNDIRGGEQVEEFELELYHDKEWNRGEKIIVEISEKDRAFGRGFQLNDVVFFDGVRYECIRVTHQMKSGRGVHEYELIPMEEPVQKPCCGIPFLLGFGSGVVLTTEDKPTTCSSSFGNAQYTTTDSDIVNIEMHEDDNPFHIGEDYEDDDDDEE